MIYAPKMLNYMVYMAWTVMSVNERQKIHCMVLANIQIRLISHSLQSKRIHCIFILQPKEKKSKTLSRHNRFYQFIPSISCIFHHQPFLIAKVTTLPLPTNRPKNRLLFYSKSTSPRILHIRKCKYSKLNFNVIWFFFCS